VVRVMSLCGGFDDSWLWLFLAAVGVVMVVSRLVGGRFGLRFWLVALENKFVSS